MYLVIAMIPVVSAGVGIYLTERFWKKNGYWKI